MATLFDTFATNANKTRVQLCSPRLEMDNRLGLRDKNVFKCLWIVISTSLSGATRNNALWPTHHPFTMPNPDDLHLLDEHPEQVRALVYDFVQWHRSRWWFYSYSRYKLQGKNV